MVSPRCGCGYETRAGFRTFKKPARPEEAPQVQVHAENQAADVDTADWRSQLEKKFESTARPKVTDVTEFHRRMEDVFREDPSPSPIPMMPRSQAATALKAERLHTNGPAAEAGNPEADEPEAEKVVPEPELSVTASRRSPEQQTLTLEPLAAEFPRVTPEKEPTAKPKPISKEILFTRLLAGILDLAVPVLVGMLFVFAASWLVTLDFFSPEATRIWLSIAGALFLLNSVYFLWTAGQTPGMSLTALEVVDDQGEGPALKAIATRVALFLPTVASVLGLAPALFDSDCRALHDRLSKTKVVHAERD